MMIAPATYVEMELAGKNREQAIKEVKSLWKEIRRLKKIIEEEPDSEEMMICPMPDVPYTVVGESYSAGRLYDKIGDTAKGTVLYVLPKGVLCVLKVEEKPHKKKK